MSEALKLADLKPGEVALDADRDRWVRTETGAVFLGEKESVTWTDEELTIAEEEFGPFTRAEAPTTEGV